MSSLKREKGDLYDKLKSSSGNMTSLTNKTQELSEKVRGAEEIINALKTEKTLLLEKCEAQKKEIIILEARTKQLQFGVQKTPITISNRKKMQAKDEPADECVFEVQKLLTHKIIKRKRQFLVRWKGYDSTEDSWVPESGLNCPKILNAYLKSKCVE